MTLVVLEKGSLGKQRLCSMIYVGHLEALSLLY